MKPGYRSFIASWRSIASVVLGVLGCIAQAFAAEPEFTQKQVKLAAREFHEECFDEIKKGERLIYRFDAAQPVDFNIHYHVARKVIYPVLKKQIRHMDGVFRAKIDEGYCLMWRNRGNEAVELNYRFRVQPTAK